MLVWMSLIFSASNDRRSFQHSSRIIGPLVRWLLPHASEDMVQAMVFGVRKCAHLTEYAILAVLCWRVLKPSDNGSAWSWRRAGNSLLIVALYAATDEIHQSFVPSRQGSAWDVLLDTAGGAVGLLLLRAFYRWREASRQRQRKEVASR